MLFSVLSFKKEVFLLMIYLNSVWYYASSACAFFFDLRPLFTLQTFHACLAFSRAVNHTALSSSGAFIPSFLLMFYLLKVPDLCPFIDASLHAFFSIVKQVSWRWRNTESKQDIQEILRKTQGRFYGVQLKACWPWEDWEWPGRLISVWRGNTEQQRRIMCKIKRKCIGRRKKTHGKVKDEAERNIQN